MKIPSFGGNAAVRSVTRGTLYAIIVNLALVLLFAGVLMLVPVSDAITKPVVQIIKVLSIFIGVMIALKQIEQRGWLFGGIVGLCYTVLAFLIFSIIYSEFSITGGFLTDMVFAVLIGAISAMLLKTMKSQSI